MPGWSQSDGSGLMFSDELNIDPLIMQVELDAVGSEGDCNAFSGIWCTAVWDTNVSPECVTPAMMIANDDAKKKRSVPTRKRASEIDLETVDEKTRKRLLKNRASAEKSRMSRKVKMQELELRCEQQEQEILRLHEQLKSVTKSVTESDKE